MFQINDNFQKLPGSYLFSTIAKKVAAYQEANPDKEIIRLGIGDVTQPLAPAIIDAMHKAVDEMGSAATFHGYAPDLGYEFLRKAISDNDYKARGCDISADEIFVSDGAKSDSANIQELFSANSRIAVTDPVYPVYVDSNVMAGRTGTYDAQTETWSNVIYMPSTADNGFVPELPKEVPDMIYLCLPNNPTGTTLTKEQLQVWVDYANKNGSVIIFDAAYEAYISEADVPHSIYVMAGRTGTYDAQTETWSNVIYMPSTADNGFVPELPKEVPDMIYLCLPNNPTGTTLTKEQLQVWVDYANKNGSVIIFDAAYEAYISEADVPHSIYECNGAKTCAIELRSFSKNAGFTGVRLGFTVVPKELKCGDVSLHAMWARRHGTKFNGAPYIVQRAGEAVYSDAGKAQLKDQVAYYMNNAKTIKTGLAEAGFTVYGGVNAPYIWLKTPDQMTSWEFFDYLLENANVVGTPGSGFGPSGEGYFRLTAFGNYENTVKALERIKAL